MRKFLTSLLIATFFNVGFVLAQSPNQYVTGGNLDVEQKISGDYVAAGGTVDIFSDVSDDVLVAAGKVVINANVGDDVRVAGGNVIINGNVSGDVLAYGGTVDIGRNASIGGDLIVTGGTVSMDGSVKGNVKAQGGIMMVRGWVHGNMEVVSNDYLQFSSSAKLEGNLKYFSKATAIIPTGVVQGSVEKMPALFGRGEWIAARLFKALWMYLAILLLGFIFCLVLPDEMREIAQDMKEDFWKNMGIGFIVLIVGGVTALIALATVIGLPVAFIIGAGFAIIMTLVQIGIGVFFGDLLLKNSAPTKWRLFGRLALGLLLYTILGLIPIFGSILTVLLSFLAFGTFVRRRYEMFHFLKAKKYW